MCVCLCVCVCESERERSRRSREGAGDDRKVKKKRSTEKNKYDPSRRHNLSTIGIPRDKLIHSRKFSKMVQKISDFRDF